jgi:hypothetical protein
MDNSGVVFLDLYRATPTTAYTYVGYFTLNTTTPSFTFTPSAAPGGPVLPPAPTLSIAHSGITNVISFGTTNGATYSLIYTNTAGLSAPRSTWSTLGSPILGAGGSTNFTDTSADPDRVYSIKAH